MHVCEKPVKKRTFLRIFALVHLNSFVLCTYKNLSPVSDKLDVGMSVEIRPPVGGIIAGHAAPPLRRNPVVLLRIACAQAILAITIYSILPSLPRWTSQTGAAAIRVSEQILQKAAFQH